MYKLTIMRVKHLNFFEWLLRKSPAVIVLTEKLNTSEEKRITTMEEGSSFIFTIK